MDSHWTSWWIGYNNTGLDFKNIEFLKRILPEVREDLAKMLFSFAEELKESIEEMSKITKSVATD